MWRDTWVHRKVWSALCRRWEWNACQVPWADRQYGRLAARKNWLYPILLRNPNRNNIIWFRGLHNANHFLDRWTCSSCNRIIFCNPAVQKESKPYQTPSDIHAGGAIKRAACAESDGSTDAAKETSGRPDAYGVEGFSPGKGKPSF